MARLIWDMHGCPSRTEGNDLTYALERYRAAGFDAVTVNVGDAGYDLAAVIRSVASFRRQLKEHEDRYIVVRTTADLWRARGEHRLAVAFDVEGVLSIDDCLDVVDLYYDLGVRWMAFVYNLRNLAGSGCHDAADDGLTPFGRRLVERMESVGIIKCCSHTGYRTALDVFAASRKPSILSHSNPRRLVDHERNVPDEVLRACAATGGVVGLNGIGLFLGSNEPGAAELFRHIDYVVQLIGPEHVGIALDTVFPRTKGPETDFADFSERREPDYWPPSKGYRPGRKSLGPEVLPGLVVAMQAAGYAPAAIDGILGGNFARVAAQCWRE
jgi:membrane dipeptidase